MKGGIGVPRPWVAHCAGKREGQGSLTLGLRAAQSHLLILQGPGMGCKATGHRHSTSERKDQERSQGLGKEEIPTGGPRGITRHSWKREAKAAAWGLLMGPSLRQVPHPAR